MSLPVKISLKGAGSSVSSLKKKQEPKTVKSAFVQDDDNDNDDNDKNNDNNGDLLSKSNKKQSTTTNTKSSQQQQYNFYGATNSASSSSSTKLSRQQKAKLEEAQALDASVFSYDEVYDNMKQVEREAAEAKKKEAAQRQPKYMEGLMKAAEQRKLDRTRAEDKMIAREREKEGEEFADKESFVTGAYKQQQEELRQAEEEMKKQEEQETKKGGGLSSFYNNYLKNEESKHQKIVEAAKNPDATNSDQGASHQAIPEHEEQISDKTLVEQSGKNVTLNAEGKIVDRSELLEGGLNLKRPRKVGPASGPPAGGFALSIAERAQQDAQKRAQEQERKDASNKGGLSAQERNKLSRERLSREMERQLAQLSQQKTQDEKKELEDSVKKLGRRNTEDKVQAMKQAALERKRKRQQDREKREQEANNES